MTRLILFVLLLHSVALGQHEVGDADFVPPEKDPKLLKLVDPVLHMKDEPPVPAEQNAYPHLIKAAGLAVSAADAGVDDIIKRKLPDGRFYPTGADAKKLDAWIERNGPALEELARGLNKPRCEWPKVYGLTSTLPHVSGLRELSQVMRWKASRHLSRRRVKPALREVENLYHFSALLCDRVNSLVSYVVAVSIEANGHMVADHIIDSPETEDSDRVELMRLLRDRPSLVDSLQQAYRVECWRFVLYEFRRHERAMYRTPMTVMQRVEADMAGDEAAKDKNKDWAEKADRVIRSLNRDVFLRDETVKMISEHFVLLVDIARTPRDRDRAVFDKKLESLSRSAREGIKQLMERYRVAAKDGKITRAEVDHIVEGADNLAGEFFVSIVTPALNHLSRLGGSSMVYREALRCVIAIQRFETKHKRLPESLDEVRRHGYLRSIPVDLFDGKSLRYDAERRLVWSVGRNGVDDGGKGYPGDLSKRVKGDDYVWRIPAH